VTPIPALVLGGTGYVAGELLRLLVTHPHFQIAAVMSDSQPGGRVADAFPHLAAPLGELRFVAEAGLAPWVGRPPAAHPPGAQLQEFAVFSAAPHGVSAALLDRLLTAAEAAGARPRVVDISADYRYASAADYAAVYGHAHGAPARIKDFSCAVPEHLASLATPHVAHPGCFATAILLASVPLLALGIAAPTLFVSGVTGSTGSGRKAVDGTHHPLRHSDLYSYQALQHRHTPEITACAAAASGITADFAFVPHSGPFARGIHVTVQAPLAAAARGLESAALLAQLREFYAQAPFVRVLNAAPRVKEVVASNYAHLHATSNGRTVAVMCALDNLAKGAAGGAVQWMNRLFDLPQTAGLTAPAPGWT